MIGVYGNPNENSAASLRREACAAERDHSGAAGCGSSPRRRRTASDNEHRARFLPNEDFSAERDARNDLKAAYRRFMDKQEPALKDSIAQDSVL